MSLIRRSDDVELGSCLPDLQGLGRLVVVGLSHQRQNISRNLSRDFWLAGIELQEQKMNPEELEGFVDADEAAKFLSLNRRRILELARAGKLPGHPIGDGTRRVWRFRLSEIAAAVTSKAKSGFSSQQRARMVQLEAVPGVLGMEG